MAYPAMDDAGAADVALVAAATSARGAGDDAAQPRVPPRRWRTWTT